ncbi:MAG: FmdB family zinc ribbon protein [Phycisphaerales bacterium]
MPTYDYKCRACGHAMELFQSMTEPSKRKCPKCGKNRLERLIGTGAALLFKGSGFYQTDYRSAAYKKSAEAEGKPAESKPAEGKPAETKAEGARAADTKPAPGESRDGAKPSRKPDSKPDAPAKKSRKPAPD